MSLVRLSGGNPNYGQSSVVCFRIVFVNHEFVENCEQN